MLKETVLSVNIDILNRIITHVEKNREEPEYLKDSLSEFQENIAIL